MRKAKIAIIAGAAAIMAAGIIGSWVMGRWHKPGAQVYSQLLAFANEKTKQADAAMKARGAEMSPKYKSFFSAARKGNWPVISRKFQQISTPSAQAMRPGGVDDRLRGTVWEAAREIRGGFYAFAGGDEKYSTAFARDIIGSIPPGSIYLGGTDPGRFLVSTMQKSQRNGDPFFTLAQNSLGEWGYLDYLQTMYGDRIYVPSHEEAEKCFENYQADARERLRQGKLKPSENIFLNVKGETQVRGFVAFMGINAYIARAVFDKNTNREFYLEESVPLDWMYPYLEPHGLIFKINRGPLPELSDDIVGKDHDYWAKYVTPIIGDWLNEGTTVEEVAVFAERAFLKRDFTGLKGDPEYFRNDYSCKMFAKLRWVRR